MPDLQLALPLDAQVESDNLCVAPAPGAHAVALYLAELGPGSRRTMLQSLDLLAGIAFQLAGRAVPAHPAQAFDWYQLNTPQIAALRAALVDRYAASTVNRHLSALRGVFKAGVRHDLLPADRGLRASLVRGVPGDPERRGRLIRPAELSALLAECDTGGPLGVRDAAVLALLWGTGLRRAELSALRLEGFDPANGTLDVRNAKRGRHLRAYVLGSIRRRLDGWLALRAEVLPSDAGPLLCAMSKAGTVLNRPLSPRSVAQRVAKRAGACGLDISPHDFRHTFVSGLLDSGVDLSAAADLVGHADIRTTRRYDARGEAPRRRAAERWLETSGLDQAS